ncbi:hypothetical protein [Rhodococcus opacus]|uniref:hypothetical protein n=1 Tax=Rhodococcus opacus TaxID=37919 RepID=UPI001C486B0B|nr:hypothetical protein [Rhodococcus opacus]MBV6758371.1 hypothetical protein [Rhodococcus opacus]
MTLTVYLFGRELLSVTFGADQQYEQPVAAPESATLMPAHGEFGFAAPAARNVDYPESRWDAQPYAHPESRATAKDTAA